MITELQLKNFPGFQDHTIPFRSNTIIVGKNNAGKSTIVEALRLISIVSTRFEDIEYSKLPRYWNFPKSHRGLSPYKNLEINKKARERMDQAWRDSTGRISLISGKRALSALSQWANEKYNASFSCQRVAAELRTNEIDTELKSVLAAIEETEPFDPGP